MPKPYSADLRKKILKAIDSGECVNLISRMFEVNIKTIYLWRKQFEKYGHVDITTGYQKGHSHKISDLEKFKEFLNKNKSLTLEELSKEFGDISPRTIHRAIQKVGYHNVNRLWIHKKKSKEMKLKN